MLSLLMTLMTKCLILKVTSLTMTTSKKWISLKYPFISFILNFSRYESKTIIRTLGSTFFFLLGYFAMILLLLLLKLMSLCSPTMGKVYQWLSHKLFFNFILRLVLEGYFLLAIGCLINLSDVRYL